MNLWSKVHYLNLLIITLIILIKSTQANNIVGEISSFITDINSKEGAVKLKELSSVGGIYKTVDDYTIQISCIGYQSYTNLNGLKFPQVNVTQDCINSIKQKFTDASDIIVVKIFREYELDINTQNYIAGITKLTDVIYYQFFPFINNEIVTSQQIDISSICGEDVVIFGPLYIDEFLKNKFVAVAGQNPKSDYKNLRDYDIFDPNAKIYKDICYPITFSYASESIITKDSFKNYDISLEQRRKYYFPGNLKLCPEDCSYLGTDKDTVSTMCQCEFIKYSSEITLHNEYTDFVYDKKKFNKTKRDNYFTMESFKCVKLPFTKSGFKGNYGSIFMIAIICIVALCYLILLVSGKYHLLSVLEMLYNSNIKSMNYIKNPNNVQNVASTNNLQIPYDARSNNMLLSNNRGIVTNGLLMSNILSGNNYINSMNNFNNNTYNKINVGRNPNANRNNGVQIVSNNFNQNMATKEKNNLINPNKIQENDYESEGKDKTDIQNMSKIELNNTNAKTADKNDKINNQLKKENNDISDEEFSSVDKNKYNNNSNNFNNMQNNNNNKSDDEENSEDDENDKKANPPKKKQGANKQKSNPNGKNEDTKNGNGNEKSKEKEENDTKRTKKKRKSKTPIEIALNVKELRDIMQKNMPQQQQPENGNKKAAQPKQEKTKKNNPPQNNNPQPQQNNGLNNMNPFLNPLNLMPLVYPPYMNNNNNNNNSNEDKIRREYEDRARQRELDYQREKELAEMREKERQREMDDLRERDRQRQRDLDYERERRQRDELYRGGRDKYYDRDGYDKGKDDEELIREKERLNQQNEEIKKMRDKLQKEYDEKLYKDREKDLEFEKELAKERDLQKQKEIEYEKEILKQKDMLKEQFEKEKKELIEKKDKEIEKLKEDKDRVIQRLKEDKDREIKYMKEDMDREKKSQSEKIKKKEKEFKKEKEKLKEMQKLTSNSFFMNGINGNTTMQQQMIDMNNMNMNMNNSFNKSEKIDIPQIVVPIDSIFTDQELNAMDFNYSVSYDKRTLCQVYLSYINRKQPLFFLFNSSSSSSISTFQVSYKSIKFIMFCIELMIYMFFYATFFGSKSITHILYNRFNFRRRFIFGIILTPFCMIAKSVIHHFVFDPMNLKIAEIKMRCYTNFIVGKKPEEAKVNEFKDFWESDEDVQKNIKEEKKEEMADIQEIENDNLPEEEKIKRKEKYEKRKLKSLIKELIDIFNKKIYISSPIMVFVLFFMWYYISAFCAVYKNSQMTFFVNIIISYGYSNLIPFIYCLIPTIFRQEAVKEESRFAFFIAQIFHII